MTVNFKGVSDLNQKGYVESDNKAKFVTKENVELNDFKKYLEDNGINPDTKLYADKFEKTKKDIKATNPDAGRPKSSFGRKFGTALASVIIPGLGQVTNGQYMKAAGVAIGMPFLTYGATLLGGPLVGLAVFAGLHICQIVDAYKNA